MSETVIYEPLIGESIGRAATKTCAATSKTTTKTEERV